jgi:hypothetical protein
MMDALLDRRAAPRTMRAAAKPMHAAEAADVASAGVPSWPTLAADLTAYRRDLAERILLFLDTLRERADQALEHEAAGLPPVLAFDYETILDARRFAPPANYALLRVVRVGEACLDPAKPPVLVMDPRAGHGPSIGGFHRESEVGIALHEGHPVYFVSFFPEPVPGQTLAHVLHALRRFVEHVASRHDGRPRCSTATARPAGRRPCLPPTAKASPGRSCSTARP